MLNNLTNKQKAWNKYLQSEKYGKIGMGIGFLIGMGSLLFVWVYGIDYISPFYAKAIPLITAFIFFVSILQTMTASNDFIKEY